MKTILKRIHKYLFGVNGKPNPALSALYSKVGISHVLDRVVRYGNFSRITNSLITEASPGTVETVLSNLDTLPRSARILDYGCGNAKSVYYRALGFNVASCDIIPIETSDFTLIDPKSVKLPFTDESFDTVIASEVIEHVESPFVLISELLRIAKNSVILTTPNPQSNYSRRLFKRTGFLYWFTPADFNYHCSPVFLWQLELFAKRHNIIIDSVKGNHEIFGLTGARLTHAESLIIVLRK